MVKERTLGEAKQLALNKPLTAGVMQKKLPAKLKMKKVVGANQKPWDRMEKLLGPREMVGTVPARKL